MRVYLSDKELAEITVKQGKDAHMFEYYIGSIKIGVLDERVMQNNILMLDAVKDKYVAEEIEKAIDSMPRENILQEIQEDKDVKWKIFYASDENVYLISDSYVKNTALPYSRTLNEDGMTVATENTPNKFTGDDPNCLNGKQYRAHFLNVVNSYSGMDRILANKT